MDVQNGGLLDSQGLTWALKIYLFTSLFFYLMLEKLNFHLTYL